MDVREIARLNADIVAAQSAHQETFVTRPVVMADERAEKNAMMGIHSVEMVAVRHAPRKMDGFVRPPSA
jgi:hypothetical protein